MPASRTSRPPRDLYGDPFQTQLQPGVRASRIHLLEALEHDPAVTGITRGLGTEISIDKVTVGAVAATAIRGPRALLDGHRAPARTGDGQIALGAADHAPGRRPRRIGGPRHGDVAVGSKRTGSFRVVSQISFPVLSGIAGLGSGAQFTISRGIERRRLSARARRATCRQAVVGTTNGGHAWPASWPGARGRAAIKHYLDAYGSLAVLPATPTSLVNFGEAVNFPLIFGVMLAVFGAATLAAPSRGQRGPSAERDRAARRCSGS